MKKLLSLRLGRAVAVATLLVGAAGFAQQAAAGISATKHNLGSTGGANNKTDGTDEICVFCHTPHAANIAFTGAPLWNKAIPSGQTFTLYNSSGTSATMDGQAIAVGSVSLACLSCHDGTQAMDNMVNAPGSGFYNSAGARMAGTWTGDRVGGATGVMSGVAAVGSGDDLSNDHPIGIPYCGGGVTGTAVTGCRDEDFYGSTTNASRLATATINSKQAWWVDTEASPNGARNKTDMILYTRDGLKKSDGVSLGVNTPSVECGSCHDPHSTNTTFLRIANTESKVCLACHVK